MSDVNNPSNFLPIKLSKKDFLQYKEELDKFFSTRKDDYKNLFESFDILKKKKLHLSYLLFSYYNSWIFPYISYTKITRGNIFSSSFEISLIFKKLSKNMNCPFDEKLFVLWYFYIYYNFFIKEKNTGENTLINQMRYILCETGKIVINLLEQKLLSIKSVINILDLILFCLEYFMINSGFSQLPEKKQKLRKLIIFLNFFHLLKKTVIFSLKKNDGFENVLAYLDKIKNNSEIIDEKNIILLFNNNILQDFMQNILDNLNICELGKTITDIKNKLVAFYSHFLKNKYKSSKIYNILQDNLRHSFEHLYNFKQNKNLIIRDVFKIDFYSAILNKLFRNSDQENINSINDLNPINSSFYFETKNSGLSFESTKKLSLDQSTLFFSFRNNNLNIEENQEIPLLIIFRNNFKKAEKSIGLKIFLKKFEKDTFKLYFSQQKDHKDEHIKILNEDSDIIINNEQTYNIAINFGKKLKIFLSEASKNNLNKIFKKEIVLNHQISNEFFSFYLGKDDKGINFYKGLIGPLIIIKLPNKDNVDKHIEEIILLKDNYKDFIIIKTDLSKNYNFISKNYFGNDFLKESKNIELIKYNSDGMLFLSPDFVKFYKSKMMYDENLISLENKNKKVPCIYECANQNQNCEFILTELNVSIYNEENFIKLLLADNCLNYFSLLFEYFSQLFRFYELKKEKDKIFEENEIKLVINYCIESIKNYLPISWKYKYPIYSDYTYKALKSMLNNLYNCILNMNKIEPIFIEIYNVLLDLNRGNKSFFSSSFMNEYDKNQKDLEQNDFKSKLDLERYNKNKYVKYNINLFIGIIDILLTPDFYNLKESKSYLVIIKKIFDEVFNDIKNNIKMIDLSLMKNIFYKLLSFIQLLTEIFSRNENEAKNEIILKENEDKQEDDMYQKLIKNIFEVIIVILKSKFNNNEDKNSVNDYLNKLFLFVFGSHIYNYDLVLNYLSIIDDLTSNLKFEENQIIELKNILFKFEKYKENKSNENKENIKAFENKIATIQSFIISKIYEYIFLDFSDKCPIKINFLEEFLKKNNISNIFVRIQSLLEKYFANIFKEESIINNLFLDMDYIKLNKYFKKIFEFLRFLLKILYSEELKDLKETPQYLDFIYNLLYDVLKNMEIEEKNFEKCIIFLINYLEFIHLSIYEGEKDSYNINFLYNEKKIVKIIEELYDRCVESTLIHCDYYFIIKDEKNLTSAIQEKKLILEILFDFYGNILLTVYHKCRKPEENKNKINEIYIAFVQGLNTFLEQKLISEFNADAYDIKNTPYLKKFKSIFFLSDFYKLAFHHNKYEKKYLKVKQLKDFSKQMNFYKKMQEIISKLKPDFIELNNQFNYFHTTYFFYQLCNLNNIKLIPFTNDEEIKKHKELKEILEKTQSSMKELKEIIISDHFKMNFICKEYYFKKRTTNDSDLKNMLKTIQVILFNKKLKNIDKKDLIQEIDKEFKTNEIKSRKSENSRGSSNSTGSNPKKTNTSSLGSKDSFDGSAPGSSSDIILEINRESNDFEISGVHNIKKDENITTQEKTEIKEVTINESFNDQIESLKRLIEESNRKNILENIDKYSIINPKKEFMKKIFGIYYSDAFFENDTFQKLKQLYLNTIITSNPDTKLLNYPSKIKNFSNGLEPCNFLKENDKFFITKILPITHHYFYEYMCKHNSLNDSIILLKSYLLNETKLEKEINNLNINKFQCEIIKPDRTYYGQIINSVKEKFILFSSQHYELFDKKLASNEIVEQIKQRGFSFSVLKNLETDNTKKARKKAKNYLLDNDIYPEEEFNSDKKILIFYDDIEEIVERRILYSWQGFEIFLKNGKSYMINMLNKLNYDKIIDILKSNKNILFRDKDFLINKQEITTQWKIKKLPTYEYLLFINKFSSRSYNDITQYYIFPWILLDFSQINEIIKNEKGIFEFKRKHKIESILKKQKKEQEKKEKKEKKEGEKKVKKEKKEKKDKKEITEEKIINLNSKQKSNEEILELVKKYRDLKYPVTAQGEKQKQIKTEKYNDEEEKFAVHHGTHYSTGSYVEYYLMRNEPYTTLIVELQNYNQEDPNRLLLRIKDTINIINTGYDNRELIPELFSKIDYLVNVNCGFFGIKKNKELVDDIDFNMEKNPLTIYNNITYGSKFILLHKKLLNSDTIALNLNNWIDNIFGIMQHPQQKKIAAKSLNIFPKSTYEQMNNLEEKLQKLSVKYKDDTPKLIKRFINKVNVIISFGQCPHVVFHEEHKNRDLIKLSTINSEQENYGLQDDYQGADFIDTYVLEQLKNDNSDNTLKSHGIYFETNPQIEKEFILSSNSELFIVDTNFYNYNDPKKYSWNFFSDPIKLPSICLLKNIQTENNNNFYIYNVKYAFSSFPSDNTNNNNTKNKNNDKNKNKSSYYLYANKIINNIPKIFEEQAEKCKIITCRHIDNSFKLHFLTLKKKKLISIETYSYICEDFVMCCKAISNNSFIIALRNGKLIKAKLYEFINNKTDDKSKKKSGIEYEVTFDKYITGHIGSINVLEINERLGIVITGGDDNKIIIRKLYDFELLTSIKLKTKFIITMVKVSDNNLLYVICFNKRKEKNIIFGYSLSGLKFAKSEYSLFTNLDFTPGGNIVTLENNSKLGILYGYNLQKMDLDEKDEDYQKYNKMLKSFNEDNNNIGWIQFNNYKKYYGKDRSIISFTKENNNKNHIYQTLKVTNISYFD